MRVCQASCLTTSQDSNSNYYSLRTYEYDGADETGWFPIWQVARATTATPSYFDAVKAEIGGVRKEFMEGGPVATNPSDDALAEFHRLFEGVASEPALLLSIGVGLPSRSEHRSRGTRRSTSRFAAISKTFQKNDDLASRLYLFSMSDNVHQRIRHSAGETTWYRRFNVDKGVFGVAFDDLQSFDKIEELTEAYFTRKEHTASGWPMLSKVSLKQTAQKLVLQRRAREAEGGPRWEGFVGHGTTDMKAPGARVK